MAKIAAPELKQPRFELPEPKLPKINLDALFALQQANLAVVQEAQSVVLEAAQAMVKAQAGYLADLAARARALLAGKEPRKPKTLLAEVKAATEKAVAIGKSNVDLSLLAQRKVADLVARRVQANIDGLNALAA